MKSTIQSNITLECLSKPCYRCGLNSGFIGRSNRRIARYAHRTGICVYRNIHCTHIDCAACNGNIAGSKTAIVSQACLNGRHSRWWCWGRYISCYSNITYSCIYSTTIRTGKVECAIHRDTTIARIDSVHSGMDNKWTSGNSNVLIHVQTVLAAGNIQWRGYGIQRRHGNSIPVGVVHRQRVAALDFQGVVTADACERQVRIHEQHRIACQDDVVIGNKVAGIGCTTDVGRRGANTHQHRDNKK